MNKVAQPFITFNRTHPFTSAAIQLAMFGTGIYGIVFFAVHLVH